MFPLALKGISLGFTAGVSPGPLQTYLVSTTLAGGWRRSLIIILSPLITDAPIVVVIVLLLRALPAEFIRMIQVAGGLFLLWLARGLWKELRAGAPSQAADAPLPAGAGDNRRTLQRAVFMNFLSPGPYIFWSTVNGPLLLDGLAQSAWHGLAFLVGFYGAFLGMMAAVVFVFDRARRIDPRVTRALLWLTVAILVVFGLLLIAQGAGVTAG